MNWGKWTRGLFPIVLGLKCIFSRKEEIRTNLIVRFNPLLEKTQQNYLQNTDECRQLTTHKAWVQLWESQKINSKTKSQCVWGGGRSAENLSPKLSLRMKFSPFFKATHSTSIIPILICIINKWHLFLWVFANRTNHKQFYPLHYSLVR